MYSQRKLHEAKIHARRGGKPLAATLVVVALVFGPAAPAVAGTVGRRAPVLLAGTYTRH